MQLVDSHCHIHFRDYPEPEAAYQAALAAGVGQMICVGTSLEDSRVAVDFAAAHDGVWASVGAHPHDGADFNATPQAAQILNKLSKLPRVVAIGEIGLDYYHQNSPQADQQKSLRAQIRVGLDSRLPFIFHIREAFVDFWPIFDEYKISRGVVHSFSAGPKELEQILSRGLYVGLNGIMTFTKDDQQLQAAELVPLNKLLLETDAPFLTPVPYRGQTCQPKHVLDTAKFLADLRGEDLQDLAAATTANAAELFNIEISK